LPHLDNATEPATETALRRGVGARLDTYRLLVQAGREGMQAGEIAAAPGIAPNTLSFHFDRLRHAGLGASSGTADR
jgi:DNA-binding transcriptional ArsR family regulator